MDNPTSLEQLDEIAIIGMVCRFPGAKNVHEFWQNLRDGVESLSFFSEEELGASGIRPALLRDPNYVRAGGVLEDAEMFSASFFGYSPRVAEIMDPQHRLFLESAWEALEVAGYDPEAYKGLIGVYAGVGSSSYLLANVHPALAREGVIEDLNIQIGNYSDYLASRVSYKLNLKGPSINIQTACSTSLVAVHMACESLLNSQCDMALAGGVTVLVPQKAGYFFQEWGVASPDGHCRAFDAKAQGAVFTSGLGIVVLKRLVDARRDGDRIQAVIKGSAINNDGALKAGYTAPSVEGQKRVIEEALALADMRADTISYIESHGTGTALGDPIEITALTQAFRASTDQKGFCALGSVKTNIGHTVAAAGIASLIKTVLALEHKLLPPSLHFEKSNPEIDFASTPFYVNNHLSAWHANGVPRRAGVSSFGMGGTNAHVILEEAPVVERSGLSRPWHVLMLSAKTDSALNAATENLLAHLKAHADLNLADVAYTLQVGRRAFDYRRMVVCCELEDAVEALEKQDSTRTAVGVRQADERLVAFMFTGQGAQYVRMARELYEVEATFRAEIDTCAELLQPHLRLDLREVLYPSDERVDEVGQQLHQTALAQPGLFATEYALAKLWMEWGVYPQAMIGHSIGEYVAACLAGVFSLEEALALMAARGRLMQDLPRGAMVAVPLPEHEVLSRLDDALSLAAINGSAMCVVSGPTNAVEQLEHRLAKDDVQYRRLHTSHAFHSAMMEPILEPFAEAVRSVTLNPPCIPFVSNMTGTWITEAEAMDPGYWAQHVRQTVRFADGLQELLKDPKQVLLEVGPGRTLSTFARQHSERTKTHVVLSSIRHPQEQQSDLAFLLTTLGRLWLAGVEIDWAQYYAHERRHRLPLPTYPFERQRYWIEPPQDIGSHSDRQGVLRKQPDIADWFYAPSWKRTPIKPVDWTRLSGSETNWLLFLDAVGLGAKLARRLREAGQRVLTVTAGETFQYAGGDAYAMHPGRVEDYHALFTALKARNIAPATIIHLWSVTSAQDATNLADTLERSFYSPLCLAQALSQNGVPAPLPIAFVSNHIQDVVGDEVLVPEKAVLLGPGGVIGREYPYLHCKNIDVVLPEAGSEQEAWLVEQLIAEVFAAPTAEGTTQEAVGEAPLAYRGRTRWSQCFEPLSLDTPSRMPLRTGGVYMITGGWGGIGFCLAQFLAESVQAKLVLVGRSPLPSRHQWEHWIAENGEQNDTARKIRALQHLEELGAQVLAVSADVAKPEEIQKLLAQTQKRFGTLHGVLHAAGVLRDGIIELKQRDVARAVLAPKLDGTLALSAALRDRTLDFFALFSSLSAILAPAGQVDYAAANAFLDAFARKNSHASGFPILSCNWPGWKAVGMAADLDVAKAVGSTQISAEEGVEVFRRALTCSLPQIVVSPVDFQEFLNQRHAKDRQERREVQALAATTNLPRLKRGTDLDAPPANETEAILASFWAQVLGVEQIDRHDNFFELGGDSILGLQVIARANQMGLRLIPKQLFQYPTIAELAAEAGTVQAVQAEQGTVTGLVPPTPMQQWFFEQELSAPHHWNQAIMLEVKQALDLVMMEKAVQDLLQHHDVLRARFERTASGWQQYIADFKAATWLTQVDLSALSEEEQIAAIDTAVAELQASLDISKGVLVRVAHFTLGHQKPGRLLLVIHHLVVDGISWRVLLADLQLAYEQLSAGGVVQFPPKTTSFKRWAEQLHIYAQLSEPRQELPYWLTVQHHQGSNLPVDFPGGINTVDSARTVSVSLSAEETRVLLQDVPSVYHTQTSDVLLTALVQAFTHWTGESTLLVDLESHGREEIAAGVDLSRTVGWFTTTFPVRLQLQRQCTPADALKAVKEQLRGIPNQGINYGILRYLNRELESAKELRSLPQVEVRFNALDQFDQFLSSSTLFGLAQESPVPWRSRRGSRCHLLEIECLIVDSRLRLDWMYSHHIHRRTTIEALAQNFIQMLLLLIEHCQSPEAGGYTPSDFSRMSFNQQDLDELIAELDG